MEPYCLCLEDWSPEIREAGGHKRAWYERMKGRGLRVKLALDDAGTIGGMIQYLPIELSFVEGRDLYFVNCIWVHGHKAGPRRFPREGHGQEPSSKPRKTTPGPRGGRDRRLGRWSSPFFMRASWFRKHGYQKADSMGMQVLLWKPFRDDAVAPKWIREKKRPEPGEGKVNVTALPQRLVSGHEHDASSGRSAPPPSSAIEWTSAPSTPSTARRSSNGAFRTLCS